jgi:hypothetical protein
MTAHTQMQKNEACAFNAPESHLPKTGNPSSLNPEKDKREPLKTSSSRLARR